MDALKYPANGYRGHLTKIIAANRDIIDKDPSELTVRYQLTNRLAETIQSKEEHFQ